MATVEVTQDNIEEIIAKNDIVILDFWAEWCGPCKSFAPAFEAASEKYSDVVFGKVDTEAQRDLAGYFQIRSIPTVMLFRDKVMLFSQPGAIPPDQFAPPAMSTDARGNHLAFWMFDTDFLAARRYQVDVAPDGTTTVSGG